MKTHRLNLYERGIVASLIRDHHFGAEDARQLVMQYIEVIRKLGGYDNCEDHAERLVQAQKTGYSPEAWLERIREIEREEIKDRRLPDRERVEYAHV